MSKKIFKEKIIDWYQDNKRLLPWRDTRDPYKIWLSEIILQQTRVAQGLPYYLKFVEKFPDVGALAAASEQDILRTWQGLGYYTRARNLHKCAKAVVEEYSGIFPDHFSGLQKLPGIGPYTAAAIASIAFREKVAVVDGNVFRVLARYFGIEKDINLPATRKYFFELANQIVPEDEPGDFNQAMMEFGALLCTPKLPDCDECVLRKSCQAFRRNEQQLLPVNNKKVKTRKRYLYYLVIKKGKKIALQKREGNDIWKGLYDFYSIESPTPQKIGEVLKKGGFPGNSTTGIEISEPSTEYHHVLSHQKLMARFITIDSQAALLVF